MINKCTNSKRKKRTLSTVKIIARVKIYGYLTNKIIEKLTQDNMEIFLRQ